MATSSTGSSCGETMGDSDRHGSTNPKEGRTEETMVEFSEDEEMLIARMFNLVGQRWSLIAGRIPGRTAEEIEKYWGSTHSSQLRPRNER
ncbi:MYB-like transcription factor ETC3 [Hibiscus syriacus]|uniref:MYB-like transcription factor ETC3 n=1 Tax=Hibiscus syriacus TaxID=106335 RepID=UPI00192335E0|nr:MYB-like transcription factor ETC3 [Hibiscus syriacus]